MRMTQIVLIFLGRICISLIFILSAIHKIFDWQGTERGLINILCDWQGYAKGGMEEFFMSILPWVPAFLVFSVVVELLGGLMLLLGIKGRLGAFLLLFFTAITTVIFHQFWYLEGLKREMEFVLFLKNTAIMGGLLFVLAYGTKLSKPHKKTEIKGPDLRDVP